MLKAAGESGGGGDGSVGCDGNGNENGNNKHLKSTTLVTLKGKVTIIHCRFKIAALVLWCGTVFVCFTLAPPCIASWKQSWTKMGGSHYFIGPSPPTKKVFSGFFLERREQGDRIGMLLQSIAREMIFDSSPHVELPTPC